MLCSTFQAHPTFRCPFHSVIAAMLIVTIAFPFSVVQADEVSAPHTYTDPSGNTFTFGSGRSGDFQLREMTYFWSFLLVWSKKHNPNGFESVSTALQNVNAAVDRIHAKQIGWDAAHAAYESELARVKRKYFRQKEAQNEAQREADAGRLAALDEELERIELRLADRAALPLRESSVIMQQWAQKKAEKEQLVNAREKALEAIQQAEAQESAVLLSKMQSMKPVSFYQQDVLDQAERLTESLVRLLGPLNEAIPGFVGKIWPQGEPTDAELDQIISSASIDLSYEPLLQMTALSRGQGVAVSEKFETSALQRLIYSEPEYRPQDVLDALTPFVILNLYKMQRHVQRMGTEMEGLRSAVVSKIIEDKTASLRATMPVDARGVSTFLKFMGLLTPSTVLAVFTDMHSGVIAGMGGVIGIVLYAVFADAESHMMREYNYKRYLIEKQIENLTVSGSEVRAALEKQTSQPLLQHERSEKDSWVRQVQAFKNTLRLGMQDLATELVDVFGRPVDFQFIRDENRDAIQNAQTNAEIHRLLRELKRLTMAMPDTEQQLLGAVGWTGVAARLNSQCAGLLQSTPKL